MPIPVLGGTFSDAKVWWWYQKIYFAIREVEKSNPELAKELATSFAGYVDTELDSLKTSVYECLRDVRAIEKYDEFLSRWENISSERHSSTGVGSFYSRKQDLTGTLNSLETNFGACSEVRMINERSEEDFGRISGDDPYDSVDWGNSLTWTDSFSDSLPD